MAGETKWSAVLTEADMNISFMKWLCEKYLSGFSENPSVNNEFVEVAYLAWCAGITYRRDQENA